MTVDIIECLWKLEFTKKATPSVDRISVALKAMALNWNSWEEAKCLPVFRELQKLPLSSQQLTGSTTHLFSFGMSESYRCHLRQSPCLNLVISSHFVNKRSSWNTKRHTAQLLKDLFIFPSSVWVNNKYVIFVLLEISNLKLIIIPIIFSSDYSKRLN